MANRISIRLPWRKDMEDRIQVREWLKQIHDIGNDLEHWFYNNSLETIATTLRSLSIQCGHAVSLDSRCRCRCGGCDDMREWWVVVDREETDEEWAKRLL
jgi:hypothetical protein